ncbi:MAG TPA: helix-turn-helix transcriptional regulator [Gemmataceae bacterium]|nr:helix-turn-helix transcriptional regulator [Gemmataceae bacterium]
MQRRTCAGEQLSAAAASTIVSSSGATLDSTGLLSMAQMIQDFPRLKRIRPGWRDEGQVNQERPGTLLIVEARALVSALAASIRTLRTARGWSQADLTAAVNELGLSWGRSHVTELESGRRRYITLDEAIFLAEVFNVRLADLIRPADADAVRLAGPEGPEQSVGTVKRVLSGGQPLDPGLIGPNDQLGLDPEVHGSPPWWVKTVGRASYVYSALEVKTALQLGVMVEDVHEVARELWQGRIIDQEVTDRFEKRPRAPDPEPTREKVIREVVDELATSRQLVRKLLERYPPAEHRWPPL